MPLAKGGRFLVYRTENERIAMEIEYVMEGEPTIIDSPLRGFLGRRLRDSVGGMLDS